MLKHTELINYAIEKRGYESYLEIGVHVPGNNFDLIKCRFKIGVDPNGAASFTGTSDEFFEFNRWPESDGSGKINIANLFDIIFIDGLHHADQVKKDIENSLDCLDDYGMIFLHDTNPQSERYTHVPRDLPTGKRWNGDVFKAISILSNFDFRTVDSEVNGITVVKPGGELCEFDGAINYEWFDKNRRQYLNLCTEKEFKEWI